MEEFDRQIKSKIDSLGAVPGVEFDEKGVWRKINPRLRGDLFLFICLIFLLTFLTIIFRSKFESQTKIVEYNQAKENTPKGLMRPNISHADNSNAIEEFKIQDLTDASINQTPEESTVSKINKLKANSDKDFSPKPSGKSKDRVIQTTPVHQAKKPSDKKKSASIFESSGDQANEETKEFSISAGKNNQTFGITRLEKINNHFYLTYGLHINRSFDSRFKTNEKGFSHFNTNQIQAPLGIRYNLLRDERRFKAYLSADFKNSFLMSPYTHSMDYNLTFDSNLILDYRILSTKDGKRNGYLRFRLPLYNQDIINQGIYKPSLYDVLKR